MYIANEFHFVYKINVVVFFRQNIFYTFSVGYVHIYTMSLLDASKRAATIRSEPLNV